MSIPSVWSDHCNISPRWCDERLHGSLRSEEQRENRSHEGSNGRAGFGERGCNRCGGSVLTRSACLNYSALTQKGVLITSLHSRSVLAAELTTQSSVLSAPVMMTVYAKSCESKAPRAPCLPSRRLLAQRASGSIPRWPRASLRERLRSGVHKCTDVDLRSGPCERQWKEWFVPGAAAWTAALLWAGRRRTGRARLMRWP